MTEQLSILNIGGHPKDVVLYAGGVMAKHAARGDRVCALSPTFGLTHHQTAIEAAKKAGKAGDLKSLKQERFDELKAACAVLGVTDVRCLDFDDSIPISDRETSKQIADIIREVRPDVIITHHPNDTVGMHSAATQMMLLALEDTATSMGAGHPPHSPQQILFHSHPGRTNVMEQQNFRIPDTIIDITSVIKLKSEAMNCFKSQHYGPDQPLQRKLGEILDGSTAGIHFKVPYSEVFLAYNPSVYEYVTLSEYGTKLHKMSREQSYANMTQMLLDEFGRGK